MGINALPGTLEGVPLPRPKTWTLVPARDRGKQARWNLFMSQKPLVGHKSLGSGAYDFR